MILIFGPAGAGKSVQGQILAARHGWRWLSTGQLLRDAHDAELLKEMQTGKLIDDMRANQIVSDALTRAKDIEHVIMDGYPRHLAQAKWLIGELPKHERSIQLVIVLEVARDELLHRLHVRGRMDDTPEVIEDRLRLYRQEVYPILSFLTDEKVRVAHIDGMGTVGQVHDRIEAELAACSLV